MYYIMGILSRTQTELSIAAICSTAGAFLSFLVGGFDPSLQALVVLVITDYLTGMIAAWKTGTLCSGKGYKGLLRKAVIALVVAFAHMLDTAMGVHTLRAMAICGYAGMEGLSILENIDRAGYGEYIPEYIRTKLAQLREEKGVVKI